MTLMSNPITPIQPRFLSATEGEAESAIPAQFRRRLLTDRRSGNEQSLAHYLEMFPGHDVDVAREFLAIVDRRTMPERRTQAPPLSLSIPLDALTGMRTRQVMDLEVSAACEQAESADSEGFGVLVVDLDGFKEINDRGGHQAGDSVLRRVSQVIRAKIRAPGAVYRYGGDEFVVLVPGAAADRLESLANSIRRAVRGTIIPTLHGDVQVSTSIGAIAVPPGKQRVGRDRLLGLADRLLYRAKAEGRNCVIAQDWTE
jgi:diguanylate cyclase (GGDEF)-like protein